MSDNCEVGHAAQRSEEEEDAGISFNPPVYKQRYLAVHELINKYNAKKVLDFGCAEVKMIRYLIRNVENMECLVGVDIDEELLKENAFRIQPLLCDWLEIRETPFTVGIYQGSIGEADERFCGFDLISCVEIIEHLIPEHLEKMPAVIFGQLSPTVVIVTTPNAEFNVLFPNLEGFRHWDHKFEWTRQEFQDWSAIQAVKYGYTVTFEGIGSGPVGSEHLGCCSQMAVFVKNHQCHESESTSFGQPYKLISEVEYPFRKSTITKQQRIIYEVERILWLLAQPTDYDDEIVEDNDDCDDDNDDAPKPYKLTKLFSMGRLKELCDTVECLRSVLEESSLTVTSDGNAVLYSPPQWQTSDSEDNGDWTCDNEPQQTIIDNDNNEPEEDWDLELNDQDDNAVCWNTNRIDGCHGYSSIYWNSDNAHNNDEIENDDNDCQINHDDFTQYNDEAGHDCGDNYNSRILNSYEETNISNNDSDDNDCTSQDDDLPWITTNDEELTS